MTYQEYYVRDRDGMAASANFDKCSHAIWNGQQCTRSIFKDIKCKTHFGWPEGRRAVCGFKTPTTGGKNA